MAYENRCVCYLNSEDKRTYLVKINWSLSVALRMGFLTVILSSGLFRLFIIVKIAKIDWFQFSKSFKHCFLPFLGLVLKFVLGRFSAKIPIFHDFLELSLFFKFSDFWF